MNKLQKPPTHVWTPITFWCTTSATTFRLHRCVWFGCWHGRSDIRRVLRAYRCRKSRLLPAALLYWSCSICVQKINKNTIRIIFKTPTIAERNQQAKDLRIRQNGCDDQAQRAMCWLKTGRRLLEHARQVSRKWVRRGAPWRRFLTVVDQLNCINRIFSGSQ